MGKLFGTDGIRGVVNDGLDAMLAFRVGMAAAQVMTREKGGGQPRFTIGKDTRISSDLLEGALIAGLCSAGADVLHLGVIPTPAVAWITVDTKADAGIVISASHNPFEHNGIKIFNGKGFKLSDELEELLGCRFDKNFCLELARLQKLGMQKEVFLDAARQTNDKTPRSPAAYFRTVLQSCERDGILTAADLGATRAKPIEQSRPKPQDDGGYLSPANLHGSSCGQENAPLADWEEAWLAQKAEIRKRRREAIERGEEVD